ncbi:MAG: hypothetical protein JSU04_06955 [Bdellovibrionales bacterium]|nr:hypothetical protein [Bdellovibrionales bacterium]
MKSRYLILGITAASMLSACGGKFNAPNSVESSPANNSASIPDSTTGNTVPSNKVLQTFGTSLRQKSSLSESQVLALLNSGAVAINASGLGSSTDVNALIPIIIQGISQNIGTTIPGLNSSQIATLISGLGTSAIEASLVSSGGAISNSLIQNISTTLFQNLSAAGVSNGNLSSVSSVLMSSLVSYLGTSGLPSANLSALLQSLSSGAVLGVGNLNVASLGSVILSDILNKIGAGSIQGLSGISSSSSVLQTLINSLTAGSQSGLSQVVSSNSSLGLNLNQLLSNVISGQSANLGKLGLNPTEQQVISVLLQLLLAKI